MTIGIMRPPGSAMATSLGTGTTKTQLGTDFKLPSDARALLGVLPTIADITPTTVQSITAKLELEGSDIKNLTPFQVLFPPIGAGLSTVFNTLTGQEKWDVFAPLQGGEQVSVYGTSLVANTVAPKATCHLIVSNNPGDLQGQMQRHAKLGTVTASGTTADTDVNGTSYNFSGGRKIIELVGLFHPKTIAAGDALIGGIKFTSSEFVDGYPTELPLRSFSYGLGATGSILIPGVSRRSIDINLKPGTVNIQDYLNCHLLPASAGSFVDGVVYV
jgi:hypothetical protein